LFERCFCKKSLVPGDDSANGASDSAWGTGGQSTPWSTAVLAEIYLLKLEAAVRAAKEAATTA
jgi:hypothetical protein